MGTVSRPTRTLPRVAIVHDLGSASIPTILAAAARRFDPIFVLDRNLSHVLAIHGQIPTLCTVVDVTGLNFERRVERLRALSPAGVLTFSEYRLADASALTQALGLPGHDRPVVEVLTDKFKQRHALAEAGVQSTRCELIRSIRQSPPKGFPYPGVLKPLVGAGSLYTFRVDTEQELSAALSRVPRDLEFVLEEFFDGDPVIAGPEFGDYISVESLHSAGMSKQICVTGKLPLAPPFRETGMFVPSSLGLDDMEAVLALERAAVRALGIRDGVTHTEIKLTCNGPKIIEVNGRLGGYVPEILKRATGINLVQAAFFLAVGTMPVLPAPRFDGITYQAFLIPPAGTEQTLSRLVGLDDIARLDGVVQVEHWAVTGTKISTDVGTQSLLGIVYGHAADLSALQKVQRDIQSKFRPEFFS